MELGAQCGVEDELEAARSQGRGTRAPLVDAGAWRRGSGGMEQREGGGAGWVDRAGEIPRGIWKVAAGDGEDGTTPLDFRVWSQMD